ncbi:MAG: hypothetical protein RJA59_761 [Pseudomonadota bacterium]|jgi:hypothetical protein
MSYQPKVYRKQGGAEQVIASGGALTVESGGIVSIASGATLADAAAVRNVRVRATAAEINGAGGKELLPAKAGYKYRIVDATLIAIGGNASGATSVDIVTTQGASAVRPLVVAVAALTQSARVSMGEAPAAGTSAILADGASFVANDENTGVYLAKQAAGSNLATATHVDAILTYVMEAA